MPEDKIQQHPDLDLAVCMAKTAMNVFMAPHIRDIQLKKFLVEPQAQTEQTVQDRPYGQRRNVATGKNVEQRLINKSII